MLPPFASPPPRARIADIATYVPQGRLTNADLEKLVDTSDEWIVHRTGIHERSVAAEHEYASDLCFEAVRRLQERAGSLDHDKVRDELARLDVVTFFGPVKFAANGQINSLQPPVFQIQGAKPVVLFPTVIKQGELKLGVN